MMPIEIDSSNSMDQSVSDPEGEKIVPFLTVPPKLREGLIALGNLSDECFATFFEELKNAAPAVTAKDLASRIESQYPDLSKKSIEKIITAVNSSQAVQRKAHVGPSEFVADVWQSLAEDAEKLVGGIDSESFQRRLTALISQTDIQLTTSKIKRLKGETPSHLTGVRIITDIRPAFMEDASTPPKAVAILHTLQIEYHNDSGEHKEFYVSILDKKDLETLRNAIDRAMTKESTISEMFKSASFQILG